MTTKCQSKKAKSKPKKAAMVKKFAPQVHGKKSDITVGELITGIFVHQSKQYTALLKAIQVLPKQLAKVLTTTPNTPIVKPDTSTITRGAGFKFPREVTYLTARKNITELINWMCAKFGISHDSAWERFYNLIAEETGMQVWQHHVRYKRLFSAVTGRPRKQAPSKLAMLEDLGVVTKAYDILWNATHEGRPLPYKKHRHPGCGTTDLTPKGDRSGKRLFPELDLPTEATRLLWEFSGPMAYEISEKAAAALAEDEARVGHLADVAADNVDRMQHQPTMAASVPTETTVVSSDLVKEAEGKLTELTEAYAALGIVPRISTNAVWKEHVEETQQQV